MKAIVLCAGEGTRLRPLTYATAKHLLPIANRPVIDLILEAIEEAGITEVGIVVSPNVEDQFKRHLKEGPSGGMRVSYILQREPRGLAHAAQCAEDFVGEEPFLVYLGDNLLERGLKDIVERFNDDAPQALISLAPVEDPRRFGVAIVEDGEIKGLIEKPKEPPSNLAIVGAYIFDRHIFEAIERIKPSWRGELEITDAIQRLIDDGYRVLPYMIKGWWSDVGRPEEMLEANRLLLKGIELRLEGEINEGSQVEGKVLLSEGARVKRSKLWGPLVVGRDAVIEDSTIGPYASIGDGVQIRESEISHSIVMEGTKMEGIKRIGDSLIGRNVRIRVSEEVHHLADYSLILGDDSRILI